MGPVAYRSEGGRIVTSPLSPGPLAEDEVLVEQVAFALDEQPGASTVGYVREVGSGLESEGERITGRLVALPALRACGACLACRRGHAGLCTRLPAPPSFASHARIPARLAVAFIPPGKHAATDVASGPPLILAALGGVGLSAYAAVIRAGVEPNRAAIVLGSGALAAFVSALVTHRGATPIRVRDPDEAAEQQIALALRIAEVEGFGVPLIDARPLADASTLALARPGSVVVLCGRGSAALAGDLVVSRALTVVSAGGAHPDLLPELCAFVATGTLPLLPLCRRVDDAEAAALLDPRRPRTGDDERVVIFAPGAPAG